MPELISRVISINDKKTSIRLASAEWEAFDIICQKENVARNHLLELLNNNKDKNLGLTNSVRLFSIIYFYHLLLEKEKQTYSSSKIKPMSPIFEAIKSIL